MDVAALLCALLGLLILETASGQHHGPVFLLEPPAQLTFSNNTGSQVSCSAHGSPTPQVDWLLQDGQTVTAVPGLRQSLGNGTLYFPPFRAEDYRKDVHFTVYHCRASNLAGTIISRDVTIRAVVNQHYDVQVYHTHVLAGNTAVLTCVIPAFVKEHVSVTSWARDDTILLPGSNMGGRIVVVHGSGTLHIRSARAEDGLAKYSCLTIHQLTQERKRSEPAILTVTEPTGSMPPRLAPSVQTTQSADRETDVHLTCPAQGNPPPTFNWFREVRGQLQAVVANARISPLQDILHIRSLKPEDAGRWTCKASNHFGEQRLDIVLTVTAHLAVHILPQLQVVNSGENAVFNCTVSGSPISRVQWLRNGEVLVIDETINPRVKLVNHLVLSVGHVTRHDKGMYQCVVRNDRESCQGSAELRLGDTVPELQFTFIEQAIRPRPQVSLRCSATGSPPPQFRWLLDGEQIIDTTYAHRYAIGQYVDQNGDVVSHLNITNVRVEDGGYYSCRAVNSLGSAEHSARLNIYGPPFIRSIGPRKAVAGSDATLHCPYAGYPIAAVRWRRNGHDLPQDLRHKVDESGALTIMRLDPAIDSDIYTCTVTSRDGETMHRNIQLIVHSPPILEPFSFPTSLQEGGRAQVTCYVTSGDMPVHFTWYKNDMPITASLQVEERASEFYSMLIFKEVTSKHSGAYTCVAANSAARANYTAHLTVKVPPQWIIEPQDLSVLLGSPVIVDCSAKGFPHPQITWLKGQGKTATDYNLLLSLHGRSVLLSNGSVWMEAVGSEDEGHYLCRATNGIGSGLGKVIYISVNEPARFDSPAKDVSTKRGGPVTLVCNVYGDTPIAVLWSLNGNRMDMNNYRLMVMETKTDNGLKSQVTISRTDREDSGMYKCLAENAYGRAEHVINLAVQERPDAPNQVAVVEVGSRSVRLAWRRSFDGNSPVIGYLVQYQPLGIGLSKWDTSAVQNITLPAANAISHDNPSVDGESAVIGGLYPATAYKLRMLAVNSIDRSEYAEEVVVKTQEEEPSEAPADVRVESVGPDEIALSWQVPSRESWNGELLGYVVAWKAQGAPPNTTKTMTVKGWATTKGQITALKKYTRYDITVRAFNGVSVGPESVTIVGTTKEGVPEAPPKEIHCSQISSQSMKLAWAPPLASQHGGFIQGYKIYYRPIITDANVDIPSSGEIKRTPSTETYLHGLYKYTNYSIKVLAYTGAGDGVLSSPIFCTTEEDVPGAPASIRAAALTSESILVSWLPPLKPNGRIILYTVYFREAGRVGKHASYTLRTEDAPQNGLFYEVRNLVEHQQYEFWVSATTSIGEGEPTSIATQATNSKAPSRIASFGQILHRAVKSKVLLPCLAVGNPTPRTRWIHRDRPVTFSPFYKVTSEGHLSIHSADQSLAGNYTCSAKNLFGEDNITYSLVVIMTPSAPTLEVQFATAKSIRLRWTQPENGGAVIQGYTLSSKMYTNDWTTMEISPEHNVYTYDDLRCGSVYHIYILAHNRVGNGSPSAILTVSTKGGPPQLPKEKEFLIANATALQLNLYNWPNGGCPITQFAISYKALIDVEWTLVSNSASGENLVVHNLQPATWYQLRVVAQNDAGIADGFFNIATTTLTGEPIPPPPSLTQEETSNHRSFYMEPYFFLPVGCILILLVCVGGLWIKMLRNRTTLEVENRPSEEQLAEKAASEKENRRNMKQQVYTSSPLKCNEKMRDDASDMYEISPYATFSVTGNNRSVTTSSLDYTMQFKTFGHIEEVENSAITYPKIRSGKHSWHKSQQPQRYYNNEAATVSHENRMRCARALTRGDSESDDTSGSPCGDYPSGSNYRVPVKSATPRDLFRRDSSTESNDLSPPTERRTMTPRHVAAVPPPRKHHRPTSTSSGEEEIERILNQGAAGVCLQPPIRFSDSRELSEAECDRDMKIAKLPVELATMLARYQERKEQEQREFTINV